MSPVAPTLDVIVLAAGQGKRMHSDLPKVLHPLAGQPLLAHVLAAAGLLAPRAVHVVYGHGGERVPASLAQAKVDWVLQAEQHGTGHAVRQAMPGIADDGVVLVLYGDVPLIRPETLAPLVEAAAGGDLALLTAELDDPQGYGRVLRAADGRVRAVVEQRDCTPDQAAVREVNTGILAAAARPLRAWLSRLTNDNAQREYYLTDVIALAAADGVTITPSQPRFLWEVMGVNSKAQLAELERVAQRNRAQELMERGVTLMDPARFDLRGELSVGRDVVIDVNVVLEGKVTLGDRVRIGPNNVIRDCEIGADTEILPNCVLERSRIGSSCRIGPFSRMRPETALADRVHIGNFVELKKSTIGAGSKINHLSYVGDTTVGAKVNIGAGTITCNYDGANKYQTVIGDGAFIGSDTQLIAPVTVGAGATVGAGTTVTQDVPPDVLAIGRARQKIIENWKRPVKKK
ncbi:MAG TPA: bifunctional UDP-N-acetylglucosamine diphosphorylase/glucosamine-1-phosphate N-acetyltransferase GlmU [Acidiferrobacterales bacterium]